MWHLIFGSFFLLSSMLISPLSAQMIVAHRGASKDAPENTLAAFRLAWEQNADAIEADIRLTADREIICIHDKNTKRVCPGQPPLIVAETDLATLRALDVGSWKDAAFASENMPTLAEVLAVVPPGKQIFIDIKTGTEILPILKKQLLQSKLNSEQIVLICFRSSVIKKARETLPEYQANWLVDYQLHKNGDQKVWFPSLERVLKTLADNRATGLSSHGHMSVIDQPFVSAVTSAGVGFHAWTIDDPSVAQKLSSYGALSLTTKRPSFIRSHLEANSTSTGSSPPLVESP